MFINTAYLYLRMKMKEESELTKIIWVLSYMQGEMVEAWKDNLLNKLSKGKSEVKTAEELFSKTRNKFEETAEEKRKVEQLRTIEQRGRTYNEYVQEFKKIARGSRYKKQPLIEEFKRGLSRRIRRKLVEAKSSLCTIEEQQERVVRLDRNQRQSRAEKRILGKNVAHPSGNAQQREGFGGGSYRGRREQIVWKAEDQNFREGAQNNQKG